MLVSPIVRIYYPNIKIVKTCMYSKNYLSHALYVESTKNNLSILCFMSAERSIRILFFKQISNIISYFFDNWMEFSRYF